MKTSKEMQLKILDKMRENIESGKELLDGVQYRNRVNNLWDDRVSDVGGRQFEKLEMRIKPETITINSVEIPKPLSENERHSYGMLYEPCTNNEMYRMVFKVNYSYYNEKSLLYPSVIEAIEASKLLFGITG